MTDIKEVINVQVKYDVDVINKSRIFADGSFDEDYFIEQRAESHRKFYRDSAFFLRWGTTNNDPEFLDVINDLFAELSIEGNLIGRKRLALNCIVSNLLLAHNRRYPVPVIINRKKQFYANRPSRYTPRFFTYDNLIPIVDSLIENGYVLYHKGSHNSIHGVASRIEASQKFLELFVEYRHFIDEEVEDETADIIQLKDSKTRKKKPQLIDYEDTKETNFMRERLENYNSFIEEQSFTLQIPEENFRQLTLTKLVSLYNSLISVGGYIRYSPK